MLVFSRSENGAKIRIASRQEALFKNVSLVREFYFDWHFHRLCRRVIIVVANPFILEIEKDKEIKALQEKLKVYEDKASTSTSKNEGRPHTNGPPNPAAPQKQLNNNEILDFIQATMATLESYKQALTN